MRRWQDAIHLMNNGPNVNTNALHNAKVFGIGHANSFVLGDCLYKGFGDQVALQDEDCGGLYGSTIRRFISIITFNSLGGQKIIDISQLAAQIECREKDFESKVSYEYTL